MAAEEGRVAGFPVLKLMHFVFNMIILYQK